ncbi:MAG: RidA family protein [Gaiellaceae bacterium]
MERRLISSGSPFEPRVGYSRAVAIGPHVWVAGTAPTMPDGGDPPAGAYEQTRRCLEIVEDALREAGAGLEHVVRTRAYLTVAESLEGFVRAHGEAFGTIRPANTTVIAQLLDSRWLVELEVEAFVP